jgi:acetyl-CoA C-acetyltransferase
MTSAYVTGAAVLPMGKYEGAFPTDLALDAIARAVSDARADIGEVDGLFTCPHGFLRERERFLTQRMAQRLDLAPKAIVEMDAGGTTGGLTFQAAVRAVESGRVRCALVYAAEVELRTEAILAEIAEKRHLVLEANALYGAYDGAYGLLAVVPLYAMCVQRYMHEHSIGAEAVARVPVVLREHAAMNELAIYRKPISVDDVLASRMVAPPIHMLEACPWANGAAALVVTSEEVARASGRPLVRVLSTSEAHDGESFFPTRASASRFPSVERAAKEALERAGLALSDVDVFEVYGAFAGVELMCCEELGLFPRGGAAAAVAEGRTRAGTHPGDRPVNPSGGRLSLGHPPYVTPLAEVAEIVWQLRGEAGRRQVKDAEVGLVHAEHGMVNGATVALLGRD